MSKVIKEPYELSVWERKNSQEENYLFTIGSDSMTTPYKANNVIVKPKVNGEVTLTFVLYTRYFDGDIGEFVNNPFINYLHNETLLKLHRGIVPDKGWDEFIIKDIQENSEAKTITYTAKRAWAIELGKTGYGLLLNSELMNNTGTAIELTQKIFEGTEWKVSMGEGSKLWGAKVDPVYKLTTNLTQSIECIRQADIGSYNLYFDEPKEEVKIPSGTQTIYIPYSSYINFEETGILQFLWSPNDLYETDSEDLIYTANSYLLTGSINNIGEAKIDLTKKGEYLQNKDKVLYLKNIDRVVTEGVISNGLEKKSAYHFIESTYLTNDTVQELIVNGKDFNSDTGWREIETKTRVYPDFESKTLEEIEQETYTTKLVFENTDKDNSRYIYNAAIQSNATVLGGGYANPKGIAKGDKFVLESDQPLTVTFAKYETSTQDGITTISSMNKVFETTLSSGVKKIVSCNSGVAYSDLSSGDYGLFIKLSPSSKISINYLSFYKYIPNSKGDPIAPSDIPDSDVIYEDVYVLKSDITDKITSFKDVVPYKLTAGETFTGDQYGTKYEKISSINVSKTNRFNALQEVCEAFECWADLVVNHEANGYIKRRADGSLDKNIVLKNYIGENKDIGFSYGLNLKSITRQLVSDQIVTKLIVEQNNNENATNGFCTIVRATDNKTKLNSIYDFSYYINQNVLTLEDIEEDFYNSNGLLSEIGKSNKVLLNLNEQLAKLEASKFSCEKDRAAAKEIRDAAKLEIERLQQSYKDRTNQYYTERDFSKLPESQKTDSVIKEIIYCIKTQTKLLESQEKNYNSNTEKLGNLEAEIDQTKAQIENKLQNVNSLINDFENKYTSFVQEGTWSDESYFDDDLYYYDAQNVLHTSAFPKVSYTIDVIDISALGDEFKPFKFNIGDKTYIEDTEFFGWNQSNSSPYREEVVISEMEEHLDNPEQNKITIQNYKTQFEDLFQRIAATTQSLQYTAGAYQRAANKITSTNELDLATLQNSLLGGLLNLQNMGNLSISWTEKGMIISSTDSSLSHKKMRLSNTGLDLSTDGGLTWRTAITGEGIVADEITTGSLNANKITIKSGEASTFIWDARGLRAYDTAWDENGVLATVDFDNYIEFNDRGLIAHKLEEDGTISHAFKLTADGKLELTGKITAKEGTIGGWEIGETSLYTINSDNSVGMSSQNDDSSSLAFWAGRTTSENSFHTAFYVTHGGSLYAERADISGTITAEEGFIGNWRIQNGNLSSVNENQGIVLDALNSQIYSQQYKESNGADGWSITNNEAIFNNITLRGSLKCAVLEYAEVQAVGGIMMIRPSTTIKGVEFRDKGENNENYDLIISVENAQQFNVGDWCKITTEADGDIEKTDDNGNTILYSGINVNLFQLKEKRLNRETNNNSGKLYFIVTSEQKENLESQGSLEGLGIISLGQTGDIGLGLNSSKNRAMLPSQSFSVFSLENNANGNWKYLKPHVILGKIPNDPIYGEVAGKYGLYADAAEITGVIHATTLHVGKTGQTPFDENGKVRSDFVDTSAIDAKINTLENKIEGGIQTWYGEGEPSITNPPWGDSAQNENHIGDLYQDDASGKTYRLVEEEGEIKWREVSNAELKDILDKISGLDDSLEEAKENFNKQIEETKSSISVLENGTIKIDRKIGETNTSFVVSSDGVLTAENAIIQGKIFVDTGHIGGWDLYGNSLADVSRKIYLSPDGIREGNELNTFKAGSNFRVTTEGYMYASAGKLGGWHIENKGIFNAKPNFNPNLIIDSDETIESNEYLMKSYQVTKNLVVGKEYTIQLCIETPKDIDNYKIDNYMVYMSSGQQKQCDLKPTKYGEKEILTGSFFAKYYTGYTPEDDPRNAEIRIYRQHAGARPNEKSLKSVIYWIKVEEGKPATDYTTYDEDTLNTSQTGDLFGLTWEDIYKGKVNQKYQSVLWIGGKHNEAPFRVTKDGHLIAKKGTLGNLTLAGLKMYYLGNERNCWFAGLNSNFTVVSNNTIFLWCGARGGTYNYAKGDDSENLVQVNETWFDQNKSTDKVYYNSKDGKYYFYEYGTWKTSNDGIIGIPKDKIIEIAENNADWSKAKDIILNTAKFYVTHEGQLYSKSGRIGGWDILEDYLRSYRDDTETEAIYLSTGGYSGTSSNLKNYWIYARNTNKEVVFSIGKDGKLVSKSAEIEGKITAGSGQIGGWHIGTKGIYSKEFKDSQGTTHYAGQHVGLTWDAYEGGTAYGNVVFWIGNNQATNANFYVTKDGKLYASEVELRGSITATQGNIAGWDITSERLRRYINPSASNASTKARFYIVGNPTSSTYGNRWMYCYDDTNTITFSISTDGTLMANKANLTGSITATSASFAGGDVSANTQGMFFKRLYMINQTNSSELISLFSYGGTYGDYTRIALFSDLGNSLLNAGYQDGLRNKKVWLEAGYPYSIDKISFYTSDFSIALGYGSADLFTIDSNGASITPTLHVGGALYVQNEIKLSEYSIEGAVRGLWGGVAIPNNSDLNSYWTPGVYGINSNASAEKISNTPVNQAGSLVVYATAAVDDHSWDNRYRTQEYYPVLTAGSDQTVDYFFRRRITRYVESGREKFSFSPWFKYSGTKI